MEKTIQSDLHQAAQCAVPCPFLADIACHSTLVVNVVVVGPFEEDEGTDITSDVVKVKGEDPATPGYYLRSDDTRKPRDRNDSPISG